MQYAGTKRQVRRHVKPEATVITDELSSYKGLDAHYEHLVINHAETYVRGQAHTNGIEKLLESRQAVARRHLHQRRAVPPVPPKPAFPWKPWNFPMGPF